MQILSMKSCCHYPIWIFRCKCDIVTLQRRSQISNRRAFFSFHNVVAELLHHPDVSTAMSAEIFCQLCKIDLLCLFPKAYSRSYVSHISFNLPQSSHNLDRSIASRTECTHGKCHCNTVSICKFTT